MPPDAATEANNARPMVDSNNLAILNNAADRADVGPAPDAGGLTAPLPLSRDDRCATNSSHSADSADSTASATS